MASPFSQKMSKDPIIGLSNDIFLYFSDYLDTKMKLKLSVQISSQTFFLTYERLVMQFSEYIEEQLMKDEKENK